MPSFLLGLGLGGFVDGIVLHEILQRHHIVSNVEAYPTDTIAGLEVNVAADGFFHVVTWLLVMAGTTMTVVAWRRGRLAPNWSFHFGLLLCGWGVFNVVEGLIDHQFFRCITCATTSAGRWRGTWLPGVRSHLVAGGWALHARGAREWAKPSTVDAS